MKQHLIVFLLLALSAASCRQENESTGPQYGTAPSAGSMPVYSLAVHPLHNPNKLMQAYRPLVDYLNARVSGARFTLEASRDYASYEAKYQARKPELLLANPWQTLQAIKAGYHVIAMAGEPDDFMGLFIVRRDSGVSTPQDLKGKAVSYPSRTALAACPMPQYFLHLHGIDVNRGKLYSPSWRPPALSRPPTRITTWWSLIWIGSKGKCELWRANESSRYQ